MSAPKPIVTPGPKAQGPPGWEEKQQARLSHANDAEDGEAGDAQTEKQHGAMDKMKQKLHSVGEKLALVPPKDAEGGTATQNASTMPGDG